MAFEIGPQSLPPVPAPLPPWARALLWIAETVAGGLIWQQFESGMQINPTGGTGGSTPADQWRRLSLRFVDIDSGETADDQYFTIDVVNITGGKVDSSWTNGDYTTVFNALNIFTGHLMSYLPARLQYKEVASYRMSFNPYSEPKPFAQTGAPEALVPTGPLGASSGTAAPQQCCSITEQTASRRNWGRFYTPTISSQQLDVAGRLTVANVNGLATAVHDLYHTWMLAEFFPCVPVTQSGKAPVRALQTVSAVAVDDVMDVQRRRRFRTPKTHVVLPTA